jgi:hypothetical protein
LHLRYGKIDLYVDLGADKFLAAEKEQRRIDGIIILSQSIKS